MRFFSFGYKKILLVPLIGVIGWFLYVRHAPEMSVTQFIGNIVIHEHSPLEASFPTPSIEVIVRDSSAMYYGHSPIPIELRQLSAFGLVVTEYEPQEDSFFLRGASLPCFPDFYKKYPIKSFSLMTRHVVRTDALRAMQKVVKDQPFDARRFHRISIARDLRPLFLLRFREVPVRVVVRPRKVTVIWADEAHTAIRIFVLADLLSAESVP